MKLNFTEIRRGIFEHPDELVEKVCCVRIGQLVTVTLPLYLLLDILLNWNYIATEGGV